MSDIFDLVNAKAIGEYVTKIAAEEEPLLGATLFPSKKIMGLDLKWVKGYKQNAVALRPSALGARAFVRDRIVQQLSSTRFRFSARRWLLAKDFVKS